ncbi:MAG: Nif3-like dinuclear metal center hexameric protein [Duncaniella sp.]|nr:Nif3-like dinuclear metal center hexameric protein [Duncaniella sp.]MDE6178296.1 Nif3-like dinuclear metal center hexameric protein [Duncaniella sp.]
MPKLYEITEAIEAAAPLALQEPWDNSGWQIAPLGTDAACTGVLLCLDVTPAAVAEAVGRGCNLVISHHPLIFKGPKQIVSAPDASPQTLAIIDAIRAGVAVYSSHTALDNAPSGPSAWLASRLGLRDVSVLSPSSPGAASGLGLVGSLPEPCTLEGFMSLVRLVYGGPVGFTPGPCGGESQIRRVALCSGSGGEFIPLALRAGADAYITSDIRYHDLLDWGTRIILADTGHYESEICTKSIFSAIISEKFPNFALHMCHSERSPLLTHVQD